jgi:hypothetical protein
MIGDDEDKLRRDVVRAAEAKQLLESELLNESLEYLKQSYMQKLMLCTTKELRESAWHLVKAVDHIKDHLVTVLNDGRLADRQIAELVKQEELKHKRRTA